MYDIFSLPEVKFPDGFLWGSATAGHQIEGDNIHSHCWESEQSGKCEEPSGKACNHYAMYKEDIRLLSDLGHQAFRMTAEWPRIEPEEGRFNQEAVDHYLDVLQQLKAKNIKVFLTIVHASHPLWFEKLGGFREMGNLSYFERYLKYIVPILSPYVDFWNVLNEFNLNWEAAFRINSVRYHALGYHIIKQYSKAPVSSAHAFLDFFPYRRYDKYDNLITDLKDFTYNEYYFHAIRTGEILQPHHDAIYDNDVKGAVDFWAVNHYTRTMVDGRKPNTDGKRFDHKQLNMIPMKFYMEEMFPEGMISLLERIKDKPVYITENGCSCIDDRFRIVYIALHMSAMKEAMDRGVDLRGYLYWSLLDNYEWGTFVPRFGLVHVDFKTFQRTIKPSALFFREIIQNNGITQEIIRKYLNEMPSLARP